VKAHACVNGFLKFVKTDSSFALSDSIASNKDVLKLFTLQLWLWHSNSSWEMSTR